MSELRTEVQSLKKALNLSMNQVKPNDSVTLNQEL